MTHCPYVSMQGPYFVRKDAKLSEFSNFGYKLFPYMLTVIVIDMVMSSVAIYSCGYRKHRKVNS